MKITAHRLPDEIYGIPVIWDPIPRPENKAIRLIPESTGRFVTHSTEGMPKFTSESWDRFRAANPGYKNWSETQKQQAIQNAAQRGQLIYRFTWTEAEELAAFNGARRQLHTSHAAPQVTSGCFQIAQHRMIGQQGAALRGAANALALIQEECSGNTEGRKGVWLFTDGTLVPHIALLAYGHVNYGIPLRVPTYPNGMPFYDDMRDCPLPWAVGGNRRRKSNAWETQKGIFNHGDVDENTHYDVFLFQHSLAIQAAEQVVLGMSPYDAVAQIRGVGRVPPVAPVNRPPVTRIYIVKSGEGLWGIAKDVGIPFSQLLDINGLNPKSVIHPGQELKLP